MIYSPLEQFSVYKMLSFSGFVDFSMTNSTLFALIASFLLFFVFSVVCSKMLLVPSAWQSIIEMLYSFVYFNIVSENVSKNGDLYFPMLISIFVFILACNLLGMIPYGFTVTSHMVMTFSLALTMFVGMNIIGVKTHGLHLLSLFLPGGAPLMMAPLLVFIEVVSYSFRVLSLSLRLFANMMSGHCLLKILAGFAWTMFSSGGVLAICHVVPLMVIFAIIGLEMGISFLQAYVFTLLLCVYLNDAISLH